MKTLILLLLTNFVTLGASPQAKIIAKNPTTFKPISKSTWKIIEVIPQEIGNLVFASANQKTVVIKTNDNGEIKQSKEYNFMEISAISPIEDDLIVLINSNQRTFLKRVNKNFTEVIWEVELPHNTKASIACTYNRIVVSTDSEKTTTLSFFQSNGRHLLDLSLEKRHFDNSPSKIIALRNDNFALISGGRILGIENTGKIMWKYEPENIQIKWKSLKQIANGEIVAMGSGHSEIFNTQNQDIFVWAIAEDGSSIIWTKQIGENEANEKAIDFVENTNHSLTLLAKKDTIFQLIQLNEESASTIYSDTDKPEIQYLKYLLKTNTDDYIVIGNAQQENKNSIIFQKYEQKYICDSTKKPNLNLISIGAGTELQFTKNDAEAIVKAFGKQVGKRFGKVNARTLIEENVTKAGELAKTFELLSTQNIQDDDLLIVYFSGNGIKAENDYLLLGSDYDPAALRSTSLKLSQVLKDLDNLPGKKLLLIDACQSGAATELNLPHNISILTASTANQVAFEDPQWQHGALTKVLIEALNTHKADSNADGYTTLNELFDYTKKKLPILTQNKRPQNPLLLHKGDDFVVFEK